MKGKTCCFIGHRIIRDIPELRERLQGVLSELIENGTVNFIFGDHSAFDRLCYESVTKQKEKFPAIKRIKFRRDYEDADDETMKFLIPGYEGNVCPKGVGNAGRASYAERNQAMIRESEICIFYYDEDYMPPRRKYSRHDLIDYQPKSGTAAAYTYAVQKKKQIINLYKK